MLTEQNLLLTQASREKDADIAQLRKEKSSLQAQNEQVSYYLTLSAKSNVN